MSTPAEGTGERNPRIVPHVGDTYTCAGMWVRVEAVAPRVVVRLVRPGHGERKTEVTLPLPAAFVPAEWTDVDLRWAHLQVITRARRAKATAPAERAA